MRKDWKYILYIVIAVAVFVLVKMTSPKQYDWTVSYSPEDKNPYGGYVLGQLMPSLFSGKVEHSYQTIYELKDSLQKEGNILVLTTRFTCEEADTRALLDFVDQGGNAFISAQYYWGALPDTLGFHTSDYRFSTPIAAANGNVQGDSAYLKFVSHALDTTRRFGFRRENIHNYFNSFDSIRTTVIAESDLGYPVAINIRFGKGNLILSSTPLAFTNIYALSNDNHEFISGLLSYLPADDVLWSEYYHFGRREIQTPLRFILTTEPLKWAYYLSITALLLYMIFEMKRRQRVIPVLQPPQNTTLEFVSTIGNLYYQNNEHGIIAEKRILFLLEHIRTKYGLSTARLDDTFIRQLSRKSSVDEASVSNLFQLIAEIRAAGHVSAERLMELNSRLESCKL